MEKQKYLQIITNGRKEWWPVPNDIAPLVHQIEQEVDEYEKAPANDPVKN